MLLHHLGQHPDQLTSYLDRMQTTEDIARVAAEAFAEVEGDEAS